LSVTATGFSGHPHFSHLEIFIRHPRFSVSRSGDFVRFLSPRAGLCCSFSRTQPSRMASLLFLVSWHQFLLIRLCIVEVSWFPDRRVALGSTAAACGFIFSVACFKFSFVSARATRFGGCSHRWKLSSALRRSLFCSLSIESKSSTGCSLWPHASFFATRVLRSPACCDSGVGSCSRARGVLDEICVRK
jgi:hypothetical protein